MRAGETELQMCVRHVAEQETRIARQEALIERLRTVGAPVDDAFRLLAEMHDLLNSMHEPIRGLYASGDIVGLFFHNYPSFTGQTRNAVFGRLAGAHAAAGS